MKQVSRADIAQDKAEQIMRKKEQEKHPPARYRFHQKKPSRWRAGICKICGVYFTFISQDHARSHGFKNADEMAASDKVSWDD